MAGVGGPRRFDSVLSARRAGIGFVVFLQLFALIIVNVVAPCTYEVGCGSAMDNIHATTSHMC